MISTRLQQLNKREDQTNLRNGWRIVRFGEVANNVDINERNPLGKGLERYVGLDHVDPESLHIKRWGLIEEGTSFTRKFVKGQVLFGKRRAYQRKVAVADFDGICSGDILVFEAKDDLLPELLPFIVQSESFYEYALSTSAGSLSPRTKWKDLASYTFALPPKDEQRRIADILWSVDEAIDGFQTALEELKSLSSLVLEKTLEQGMAFLNRSLNTKRDSSKVTQWQKIALENVLFDIQYGTSERSGIQVEYSVPVLRIPNVVKGNLDLSDLSWIVLPKKEQERFSVREGDILLVRTNGNPSYVGRSVVISNPPKNAVYASYLIRLRVDESQVRPAYVNTLLNSQYVRATLRHEIRSSAGNYNLNTVGIKRQQIPLPTLLEHSRNLKKRLLEYLFSASIKG
jgi:type I restriction enzyme, S subunit